MLVLLLLLLLVVVLPLLLSLNGNKTTLEELQPCSSYITHAGRLRGGSPSFPSSGSLRPHLGRPSLRTDDARPPARSYVQNHPGGAERGQRQPAQELRLRPEELRRPPAESYR